MLNRPNCPLPTPDCTCAQSQAVVDLHLQLLQRHWFTAEDTRWWSTLISAEEGHE